MVSCHNSFGFIWFGFEQKVEMQVDINCGKCKNQIMQAVTELEGIAFFFFLKEVLTNPRI